MSARTVLALRMDDVGASSKAWEIYGRRPAILGPLGAAVDILILKALPPFRAWGPYRELDAREWSDILRVLQRAGARMTVGITAAWVTWSGELVPFPERFPRQADVIARGVAAGLLEVANHGLTHCVLERHAFRPRLFSGNRTAHREFWSWIPAARHREHLARSQAILRSWLGSDVVTFVPPGNVFTDETVAAARDHGIRVISCATRPRRMDGIAIVGNERVRAFHDRDVVVHGIGWLEARIAEGRARGERLAFVRELDGLP